MLPMTEPVTELTLEAPAGLIRVRADCRDGKVTGVTFRNVPAFATHLDAVVEVPHLGTRHRRRRLRRDVLRHRLGGGVRAAAHARRGRRHRPDHRDDQGRRGRPAAGRPSRSSRGSPGSRSASCRGRPTIRRTRCGTSSRSRPGRSTGSGRRPGPGAIDRSPCGTGTSARMATLHARGRLAIGEDFRHEGILGTVFTGRLVEETPIGERAGGRPGDHRPGLDHRASRTTWSTRPTRSPTASRSATSGPDGRARPRPPQRRK